jgi:predicted O-methyltransferase YrrM
MGRKTQGVSQAIDLLRSIFDLPKPREEKCRTLYYLAKEADNGAIVELGTYHGNGAIALCLGARDGHNVTVYTIDDYETRHGWAGEPYVPEDLAILQSNLKIAKVNPILIMREIVDAADIWPKTRKIDLLFWDAGSIGCCGAHIAEWQQHVQVGGLIAIHDTYDDQLGARAIIDSHVATGKYIEIDRFPGGIYAMERVDE